MNKKVIEIWNALKPGERRDIFNAAALAFNLPPAAIEKDWWVVRTLEVVYQTEIGEHIVFKGGTSLSKAWNLINRFSEDIDLAMDRKFLGFDKVMTGSQVSKLRKQSFRYVSDSYLPQLKKAFSQAGFTDVKLTLVDVKSTDEDPVKIQVNYPALTEGSVYLVPRVLIEIGCRSLIEPFTVRTFSSFVGEHFKGRNFADIPVTVPTVNPERTFLEKIFLLHEEFQQHPEKIRIDRKSRHLYDLEKLMDTDYAKKAVADSELYRHLVEHRKTIIPIRGIDYNNHAPEKIDPVPPEIGLPAWKKDYEQMQESMIIGDSLSFDKLIKRIIQLKGRINKIKL